MIKKRPSRNFKMKNKIIISCEDSSEGASYKYFDLIKRKFNLKQKIQIIPSARKSNPLSVAKRAKNVYVDGDSVFVVVDKDKHNHERAIEFLKTSGIQNYTYVLSNPCFEYWLLLHEIITDKPFDCSKSLCKELEEILKPQGIEYSKTMDYRYFIQSDKIKQATQQSEKIYRDGKRFTNIHELILNLNSNNNIYN